MIIYIYFAGMKTSPELKQVLKDNKKIELKIDSLKKDNEFLVARMFEMEKNQTVFYQMISETNDLMKINNKRVNTKKQQCFSQAHIQTTQSKKTKKLV